VTAPLRVAVIGLGVISRFYLAALRDSPAMRLVAVCDSDPAVSAAHPVPGYTDHRRLLRETWLDAVVVTVPNDVHAQVCADALEHGVAVCVEKPLALDTAQGVALRKLAERRDVPLFTAFHRRYNQAVARLRAECAGSPVDEVTVRYLERIEDHAGPDGWYLDMRRCGGGCVADNGPNAYDLVRLLLGPAEVTSARITRDADGVDRQADVRLRAGDGRARILLDWSHPGERKDIEVRLADGRTVRADMLAGHTGFKGSLWHEYVEVLDAFARYVRGSGECDGGLAALRFVRDAYRLEDPGRAAHRPAAPVPGRGTR
jgi:predicted dehydrogenase